MVIGNLSRRQWKSGGSTGLGHLRVLGRALQQEDHDCAGSCGRQADSGIRYSR